VRAVHNVWNDWNFWNDWNVGQIAVTGEEVEKIVAGLFKLDAAVVAKMSEILK
jgi:hypothetical protein